jgi:cellulose synthase/poly-beta-1,6-N-acetylglucosamine synthase-like glycosyltransferase
LTVILLVLLCLANTYAIIRQLAMLLAARAPEPARSGRRAAPGLRRMSVIVPCFNEESVLAWTLDAIFDAEHVDLSRVICVDDGSTDRTLAVMEEVRLRYGDRVMVLSQPNAGKAAALNRGLQAVDTELFVSIDADTQVLPDALWRLAEHFDDHRVAAVSGQMLVGNRHSADPAVYAAQVREYEYANNIDRRAFSRASLITVVPGAIGAFRTAAVRAIGGYPHGTLSEDAYLTFLLLIRGYRTVHEPRATVVTEAPDLLPGLLKQRIRWATGRIQVVLRTAAEALRARQAIRVLWVHEAFSQGIASLIGLTAAVVMPILLVTAVVMAIAGPDDLRLERAIAVACLLSVVRVGVVAMARRFARTQDAAGRRLVGLPPTRTSARSLVLLPVVRFVATCVAWHAIATRKQNAWNKVDRTGDVRLPAS